MQRVYRIAAAAIAAATLPSIAMAQLAVSHMVTGSATVTENQGSQPRTLLPTVSARVLPLANLLRNNQAPQGLKPGVMPATKVSGNAYGAYSPTSIMPYTFSQVVNRGEPTSYPWRASGQLKFLINGVQYVCSASMIRPGILVTAAHCVFSYGTNSSAGWYSNWVFVPGESNGFALNGTYTARQVWIPTVYYNGSDNCFQTGVICNNDIATIIMNPNSGGVLPGNALGWYGYGWNGYGFVNSFGGALLGHVTEMGYPCAWDNCGRMERNDATGAFWSPSDGSYQTILGTPETGGSSGGPWIANFGFTPSLTGSASLGSGANQNVVVAVTSWGYTSVGNNTQGASWWGQNAQFPNTDYLDSYNRDWGAGNIGAMVSYACSAAPSSSWC